MVVFVEGALMHFGDRIVSSFSGSRGAGFAPGAADSGPVADARAAATVAVGRGGCGHNDGLQLTKLVINDNCNCNKMAFSIQR